jgi:hypothetical protein
MSGGPVVSDSTLRRLAVRRALSGPSRVPFDVRYRAAVAHLSAVLSGDRGRWCSPARSAPVGWEVTPEGNLQVKGWVRPVSGWVGSGPARRDAGPARRGVPAAGVGPWDGLQTRVSSGPYRVY